MMQRIRLAALKEKKRERKIARTKNILSNKVSMVEYLFI